MSKTRPLPAIAPEVLVPRFGDYMVTQGLITEHQLKLALDEQFKSSESGHPKLLGQTLVELNFLSREALDRTITEQIINLRQALENSNRNLEKRVEMRTAELQDALKKLSELNQMKASFIANISHELRTPLTHIQGYIELLAAESLGPITDDQKKALKISLRSTGKLKNLIDDLILFSLASRGEMSMSINSVSLSRLAVSVWENILPRVEEKQLEFKKDFDADLPFVKADEQKISWVLNHLLDNAIKFTRQGSISLSVKRHPDSPGLAWVTVSDTGIGFEKNKISEIFEPFHQLDGSSTRQHGGTGLGLALVRQILEAHGAVLNVESALDKGASFSFMLPFESSV